MHDIAKNFHKRLKKLNEKDNKLRQKRLYISLNYPHNDIDNDDFVDSCLSDKKKYDALGKKVVKTGLKIDAVLSEINSLIEELENLKDVEPF